MKDMENEDWGMKMLQLLDKTNGQNCILSQPSIQVLHSFNPVVYILCFSVLSSVL